MSTTWRPRDSRKCVPTPTGPGVSISTFVMALMRPEAFSKSDAMAHMRSGGAGDRYVQSSGFIGWVSSRRVETADYASTPPCSVLTTLPNQVLSIGVAQIRAEVQQGRDDIL